MIKESNPDSNPNLEWWIDITANNMKYNNQYVCMVSEDENGNAAGFIDMNFNIDPVVSRIVVMVNSLYVTPEFRNRGVGWKLINAAMEISKMRGAERMVATSTAGDMWTRHGFSVVGSVVAMVVSKWKGRRINYR